MTAPRVLDALDIAIAWDRLISIADEGAAALVRASFSTLVRESLDLSVMLFDAQARMIAQSAKCIPVFIGTAPVTIAHMLAKYPPEALRPGDVVVSNDPVIGTGHMFDIAVMRPIFHGGAIIAYAMSITHLPDIGGMGFSVVATEIYHEGLRLPIWKLFDAGKRDENLVALIRLNVRVPDQVLGDIMANVSCVEVVGAKLVAYLEELALPGLDAIAPAILAQTEAAVRQAIAAIPDGTYENALDVEALDQVRRLACRIEKNGDTIAIDFAGTGPCIGAGINVPLAYTRSMALYTIKCLTTPLLPNNDGATVPITVSAPVGCILNAVPPAPSAGRHTIGHFVMPLLFGAFAEVMPDQVTAESGLMNILTLHGTLLDGSAMSATYFASGGFGAMQGLDGRATTPGSSNMGGTPVEILEPQTGLVVERKALRPDSGGAGAFRGGAGQDVVLRNDSGHPMTIFSMANRTRFAARGIAGGAPGAAREHLVNGLPIATQGRHVLAPGDRLLLREAGGGGCGPAKQRPEAAVRGDLAHGLLSPAAALRDHGVLLDADDARPYQTGTTP